jgi:hypothetical protein
MLHSKQQLYQQTNELIQEYKKFNLEFEKYIDTFESCSTIKREKFIVDQLFRDIQRNYLHIQEHQLQSKLNKAKEKLEQLNLEFLKGMLNNGFFIK